MVFAGKGLYTLSGGTLNVAGVVSDQSGSGLIDVTGGTLNMTGGTDGIAVQVDSGSIEWTQGGFGSVVNVGPQGRLNISGDQYKYMVNPYGVGVGTINLAGACTWSGNGISTQEAIMAPNSIFCPAACWKAERCSDRLWCQQCGNIPQDRRHRLYKGYRTLFTTPARWTLGRGQCPSTISRKPPGLCNSTEETLSRPISTSKEASSRAPASSAAIPSEQRRHDSPAELATFHLL